MQVTIKNTAVERNSSSNLPDGWRMVRFGDVVRNVNVSERNPLDNGLERLIILLMLNPTILKYQTKQMMPNLLDQDVAFLPLASLFVGLRLEYHLLSV